jgi:transposase
LEIIEIQQQEIKELKQRITKLENELQKYHNENTPSGSIPPYLKDLEKNIKNRVKDKTDEPPKDNERNSRSMRIDRKEYHELNNTECPNCGNELTKKKSTRKRIVIEMPIPSPQNVEHELALYYCKKCGHQESANVPNALPNMKFDINTLLLMSYFSIGLNVSLDGIAGVFRDVFHVGISKSTVSNDLTKLRKYLGDYYTELEKEVKNAAVRYKDETSVRNDGKTFWMWVVSTGKGIMYRIEKSRGIKVAQSMSSTEGVDVCDGYRAYDKLPTTLQRCWAHVFRRLRKPVYDFGENESYTQYKKFSTELCILFSKAKKEKVKCGASKDLRKKYEKKVWNLLESIENKNGRNIVRVTNYILKYFDNLFTFLEYEEVEPTNNEAERALRHFVVKRKISQQYRGIESMDSYQKQLSLYMTSKLNGENYVENLQDIIDEKRGFRR